MPGIVAIPIITADTHVEIAAGLLWLYLTISERDLHIVGHQLF